jgi:cytoskeletal protein CcmA (bactofilin family)
MFELGKRGSTTSQQDTQRDRDRPAAFSPTPPAPRSPSGETAVIGRSIKINGDLRGEEDLRIEGDVSGTVQLRNSCLTVGHEGKIKADLYAKEVIVDGYVEGDVYASERVSIRSNAHVLGNVTAPRVGIEDGARFKGSIEMDQEAVASALGKTESKPARPEPSATPASPEPADTKVSASVKKAAGS